MINNHHKKKKFEKKWGRPQKYCQKLPKMRKIGKNWYYMYFDPFQKTKQIQIVSLVEYHLRNKSTHTSMLLSCKNYLCDIEFENKSWEIMSKIHKNH